MNKEKGITLIALVITIIVMMILVGATVSIVLNGGLIDITRNSARKHEEQDIYEKIVTSMVLQENDPSKINVQETYSTAKSNLEAEEMTVETITSKPSKVEFGVTGKYGTYYYRITQEKIEILDEKPEGGPILDEDWWKLTDGTIDPNDNEMQALKDAGHAEYDSQEGKYTYYIFTDEDTGAMVMNFENIAVGITYNGVTYIYNGDYDEFEQMGVEKGKWMCGEDLPMFDYVDKFPLNETILSNGTLNCKEECEDYFNDIVASFAEIEPEGLGEINLEEMNSLAQNNGVIARTGERIQVTTENGGIMVLVDSNIGLFNCLSSLTSSMMSESHNTTIETNKWYYINGETCQEYTYNNPLTELNFTEINVPTYLNRINSSFGNTQETIDDWWNTTVAEKVPMLNPNGWRARDYLVAYTSVSGAYTKSVIADDNTIEVMKMIDNTEYKYMFTTSVSEAINNNINNYEWWCITPTTTKYVGECPITSDEFETVCCASYLERIIQNFPAEEFNPTNLWEITIQEANDCSSGYVATVSNNLDDGYVQLYGDYGIWIKLDNKDNGQVDQYLYAFKSEWAQACSQQSGKTVETHKWYKWHAESSGDMSNIAEYTGSCPFVDSDFSVINSENYLHRIANSFNNE